MAGGSSANGGTRLAHTYTNSGGDDGSTVAGTGSGDTKYAIRLRLLTHSTANPSVIPKSTTNNFEVYSTHTVLYSTASSTIRGINEESTSGFPVTFTNDTATNPGANGSFSATQQYHGTLAKVTQTQWLRLGLEVQETLDRRSTIHLI